MQSPISPQASPQYTVLLDEPGILFTASKTQENTLVPVGRGRRLCVLACRIDKVLVWFHRANMGRGPRGGVRLAWMDPTMRDRYPTERVQSVPTIRRRLLRRKPFKIKSRGFLRRQTFQPITRNYDGNDQYG